MSEEPPWQVHLAPAAVRALQELPARAAVAVVEFVTATLPTNPRRLSKPLRGDFEGLRSARRGDYRVLFSSNDAQRTLLIIRISHRAHAYRRR